MDIFLFSNHFPYKRSEPFLINEFTFATKFCRRISVLALYGQRNSKPGFVADKDISFGHVLGWPLVKSELLRKGIFNLQPASAHLADLLRRLPAIRTAGLRNFVSSLLITRAVLSSREYKAIVAQIRNSDCPVLYFYWGDYLTWTLPHLKKAIGNKEVKVVIRLHNTDLYEERKGNYSPLRRAIFSVADLILPISRHGCDYLIRKYPEFASKMSVSRLGVFDRGLNPDGTPGPLVVVSASFLVPVKQVSLIFHALQSVREPVVWHHFGDGPLMPVLKDLEKSKRPGLEVRLHGQVENALLIKFYQQEHVDVFVNASLAEGVPVSIMEALSFGIPVIAPDVGGVSELVDSECGVLMRSGFTVEELSAYLEEFSKLDSTERMRRRQKARNVFETKANADVIYPQFYEKLRALSVS